MGERGWGLRLGALGFKSKAAASGLLPCMNAGVLRLEMMWHCLPGSPSDVCCSCVLCMNPRAQVLREHAASVKAPPGGSSLLAAAADPTHIDAYAVLGVAATAAPGEVKKRYMRLSLLIHPDKCGHAMAHEVGGCFGAHQGRTSTGLGLPSRCEGR